MLGRYESCFALEPHAEVGGAISYRTNNIPGGLCHVVIGIVLLGPAVLILLDEGTHIDLRNFWLPGLGGLAGAAQVLRGIVVVSRRRRLVVDPIRRTVELIEKSLIRTRRVSRSSQDVPLCVHPTSLDLPRWRVWRGWTLTADLEEARFSLVRDRQRDVVVAAAERTAELTGLSFRPEGEELAYRTDGVDSTE